jgi:uncharacterized protein (DUF433 family)
LRSKYSSDAFLFVAKLISSDAAMTLAAITKDQTSLGGVPVFRNTRVPFQALLDYLEGGRPLGDFLDDFPTVTREAAIASLEEAGAILVAQLK